MKIRSTRYLSTVHFWMECKTPKRRLYLFHLVIRKCFFFWVFENWRGRINSLHCKTFGYFITRNIVNHFYVVGHWLSRYQNGTKKGSWEVYKSSNRRYKTITLCCICITRNERFLLFCFTIIELIGIRVCRVQRRLEMLHSGMLHMHLCWYHVTVCGTTHAGKCVYRIDADGWSV